MRWARGRTTRTIWEESKRGGFNHNSSPTAPDESTEVAQPQSRRRGIVIVVVVVLVLVAVGFWWRSTFSEDTDDAQINGHLIQVSSRIAGQVIKVDVDENQVVKAGDAIAELDPRDFQVAVENAQAALASAQANAAAANVNVPITTINTGSNLSSAGADVSGAHARVAQAEQQLAGGASARGAGRGQQHRRRRPIWTRYKPLVEKDVISKQQFDAAVAAADAAKAAVADAQASEQAAGDGVRVAHDNASAVAGLLKYAQTGPQQVAAQNARAKQAEAQVQQAQAQLDQAKLNLSYYEDRGAGGGHHHAQERGDQPERFDRAEPADAGFAGRSLGDGELQGDAAASTCAGQPVEIQRGRNGQELQRQGDADWRRDGFGAVAVPAGECDGQLREGGAARSGAHRLHDLKNEDPNHVLRPGLSVEPKVRVKP